MRMAKYTIKVLNDLMVIIFDDDEEGHPSVTDSAEAVINDLDAQVGGLGSRRVFYRDLVGRFDELCHTNGAFTSVAACKPSQQESFREMSGHVQDNLDHLGHLGSRVQGSHPGSATGGLRHLKIVPHPQGS